MFFYISTYFSRRFDNDNGDVNDDDELFFWYG